MTRARLMVICFVAACTNSAPSDGVERQEFLDEGFSCVVPDGWTVSRDVGATMFSAANQPRRTVAVRSVALDRAHAGQSVAKDTEQVLRALPSVALEPARSIDAAMPATEYRLTFQPPNTSARYVRRHVLVTGRRHAFHVIETSPAPGAQDDLVLELVESLREES